MLSFPCALLPRSSFFPSAQYSLFLSAAPSFSLPDVALKYLFVSRGREAANAKMVEVREKRQKEEWLIIELIHIM